MPRLTRAQMILLGIAGFVGIIDTAFMASVVAPYAEYLGASKPLASFTAGLYGLVAIFASPVAGIIVDRIGRRKSLIAGLAWDTLFVYLYGVARSPKELLVVRSLHAVGGSLVYPAFMATVGDTSSARSLGSSIARYLAIIAIAIVIGALTASATVDALGFRGAFTALSLIIMLGFISAIFLPETLIEQNREKRKTSLVEVIRKIKLGLVLIFLLYFSFGIIVGGLGLALKHEGIVPSEEEAAVVTGMSIGFATLVSIPSLIVSGYSVDRGRVLRPVTIASILSIVAVLGLLIANNKWHIVLIYSIYGLSIGAYLVASSFLVLRVEEKIRGFAVALQQTVNIIGVAVSAPIAGILVEAMGIAGIAVGIISPLSIGVVFGVTESLSRTE